MLKKCWLLITFFFFFVSNLLSTQCNFPGTVPFCASLTEGVKPGRWQTAARPQAAAPPPGTSHSPAKPTNAEVAAQRIWWTLNQSQARAAGTYFPVSPKQSFCLHQMIVIILAWSYLNLSTQGENGRFSLQGSACQMLVCSFQRARPIDKDIIPEDAGEADPGWGWRSVWHLCSPHMGQHVLKFSI